IDDSRTPESRELVARLSESKSFQLARYYFAVDELGDAISRGDLDAGLVIPEDYANDLQRGRSTTIQLILNAMNANTAAIGQAYAEGVIQSYNNQLRIERVGLRNAEPGLQSRRDGQPESPQSVIRNSPSGRVLLLPAFLYNPGLVDSWFIVTGV